MTESLPTVASSSDVQSTRYSVQYTASVHADSVEHTRPIAAYCDVQRIEIGTHSLVWLRPITDPSSSRNRIVELGSVRRTAKRDQAAHAAPRH